MKFKLTKKQIMIGLVIGCIIIIMSFVIIIMLNTGNGPDGCGAGYKCKNEAAARHGDCIDSKYCGNFGMVDNQSDCNCKMDCPSGQQSFPSSVNMKKDPNDSTKWIPDGPKPVCGIPCPKSGDVQKVRDAVGGVGYCAPVPDQYCGEGPIYVKGQKENVWQGCFPKSEWTQCTNSLCPTPTDGSNPCTSDGICKITDYCGKDNQTKNHATTNLYQACQGDPDCHDMYGNKGTCYFEDSILTDKNITKVGYCQANPGETLHFTPESHNSHCTTLDKIGNDAAHNLTVCTGKKSSDPLYGRGVDGSIQCKDTAPAKGCAPDGICSTNKWQAYFDSSQDVTNCLTNEKYDPTKIPLCCSKDRTIVSSGGNWCCPVKDTTDCANKTANPYSANMLNIPNKNYTDSVDCNITKSVDSCSTYQDAFQKSLTVGGFKPSSTSGDAKFAKLFCDTSIDPKTKKPINKCKATCGYVDSDKGISSDYAVSDDSTTDPKNPISFCTPKDTTCNLLTTQNWDIVPNPINNIPLCYNSDNAPTGKSTDKFYWSAPDDHKTTYKTQFSRDMTGDNCNTPNMCAALGKDINGVYKINPGQNSCEFTVNCNNNFMMKPSGMDEMKWSDGLTGLDDTNWTTCPDGTICPNKTKQGTVIAKPCPCSNDAMWKPIAQSGKYTPDSATQTCSGNSNKIPKKLTIPLQYYENDQCKGDPVVGYNTNLNTTGGYCPTGIVPETNICNPNQ